MPVPALEKMIEKTDKSLKDAERYWDEAKEQAKDQGFSEGSDRYYQYVMGIVKKRLGLASLEKVSSFLGKEAKVQKVYVKIDVSDRDSAKEVAKMIKGQASGRYVQGNINVKDLPFLINTISDAHDLYEMVLSF